MVRAPRRAAVLEPLEHHERRVEDRHGEHEQRRDERDRRGGLEHAVDRQGGEQEAQRERPGVAHEDLRRVVVVEQERQRRAAHDRRQHRGVRAPEGGREDRERRRPRSPTIPAASESMPSIRFTRFASSAIHRTVSGYAIQPRSKSPMPGSVRWSKRHVEAGDRDQRDQRHADELAAGGDAVEVVEEPERGDEQRADEDAEVGAVEVDQDRRRDQDPGHDRQPADARDRALCARAGGPPCRRGRRSAARGARPAG